MHEEYLAFTQQVKVVGFYSFKSTLCKWMMFQRESMGQINAAFTVKQKAVI